MNGTKLRAISGGQPPEKERRKAGLSMKGVRKRFVAFFARPSVASCFL